jgi:hypothetical protein
MKVVALDPDPKRHINLVVGQKKCASCNFEAVEGVDVLVLVCCEDDVVDVRDESLKSHVVAFVGQPGFCVDGSVLVAKVVVSLCCEKGLPISVKHCDCDLFS